MFRSNFSVFSSVFWFLGTLCKVCSKENARGHLSGEHHSWIHLTNSTIQANVSSNKKNNIKYFPCIHFFRINFSFSCTCIQKFEIHNQIAAETHERVNVIFLNTPVFHTCHDFFLSLHELDYRPSDR